MAESDTFAAWYRGNQTPKWLPQPMLGTVTSAITPEGRGRVKFQGVYWNALPHDYTATTFSPGETVRIVGRRGSTLLVTPVSDYGLTTQGHRTLFRINRT